MTESGATTEYIMELIKSAYRLRIAMVGICHGHHAINVALGGRIERLSSQNRKICESTDGPLCGLKSHSIIVVDSPFRVLHRREKDSKRTSKCASKVK